MNIVALEQLWVTKDATTVAEHARLTALTKPEDLPALQKKWARGEAIRRAYREKKRALAGQPKPEKPKKQQVQDPRITMILRKIEEDRAKANHQKQDAKLATKRAAEDEKLAAKRAAKHAAEDAKIAAKRAAEDERRAQNRAKQAAKRADCRKAADVRTQAQAQAEARAEAVMSQAEAQAHQAQAEAQSQAPKPKALKRTRFQPEEARV